MEDLMKQKSLTCYKFISVVFLLTIFSVHNAVAEMPKSFADLAETVSPSVVNITTSTVIEEVTREQKPVVPKGSPFEDLFKDFLERDQNTKPRASSALGSGFIISEDGYIVTNNHVISKADEIEIELFSGELLKAKVVGFDLKTDIALLKVDSDVTLPFVSFGDSDVGRVGDWVMAVGNPLGQGFSVSIGIISARKRELAGAYDDFIQTDAAINRGNSGGPLFNTLGDVIGVNTAILSPTGGSVGIGFSMSSNVVSQVVAQLKEFGETRRGWLGVRIQDLTEDIAEAIGIESIDGILVTEVPDGPAKDGGIKSGDIILVFDEIEVGDTKELVRVVGKTAVDKTVNVVLLRKGKRKTVRVRLGQRELAEATAFPSNETPSAPAVELILGMSLSVLDDSLRSEFNLNTDIDGLIVRDILKDSEAYEKGIRVGHLIVEVSQKKLLSLSTFKKLLQDSKTAQKKSLLFLIRSENRLRFLSLRLD
jgi:serine protease Do